MANFTLATALDVMRGQRGVKDTNSMLAGVRETRRNIQVGQSIGENKQVVDEEENDNKNDNRNKSASHPVRSDETSDADLAEEMALLARLKAIRERRDGQTS